MGTANAYLEDTKTKCRNQLNGKTGQNGQTS